MKKVAIVTDSTSTIPSETISALNIRVVPTVLNLEGRSYLDGIDITPDEFYRMLRTGNHLPTTSAPSIGDFLKVYKQAGHNASGIVSIHLSKNFSSAYMHALQASQLIENKPIEVIDCQTVGMAMGFAVIAAARKAAGGASLEEVVAEANRIAARGRLFVMLDTLTYLRRSGRIGTASWLFGSLLQLKPILYVLDGQAKPLSKPRTRSKGIKDIIEEMKEQVKGKPIHAAIAQADEREDADLFKQQVANNFDCRELYITEFTPVMGAHAGPGVLGVAFYVDEDD